MEHADLTLARTLLDELHHTGFDGVGITRDTYGDGEQAAHRQFARVARELGLEVTQDAALNLYLTLPGRDRALPRVITGSHLDSVPRGGNYDGAAGVVAGMAVLSGWLGSGFQPARDVTVMGIRAEESAWFPVSYIGSKAAFGLLPADALQARRAQSGATLEEHLTRCGGDPTTVAAGSAALTAAQLDCFIELHIEQGPVLIGSDTTLGVVSGICGSLRYRQARALGQYAHSGATPRAYRHDAVSAVAELVTSLNRIWAQLEAEGHELTVTIGQFATDPVQADFSKVNGDVRFCIDLRSRDLATLERMDRHLLELVRDIAHRHGVTIDLGAQSRSSPAWMDAALQQALTDAARARGIATLGMPSGAGHDAALFADQGVPTAMLFVRNANGSHNPDEALAFDDFAAGIAVLDAVLRQRASR